MKYGCKSKNDVLLRLNYMVIHAPDFPPEGGMTLSLAFDTVEHRLSRIESEDARPAVVALIARLRAVLRDAQTKFDAGEIVPACHLLQDAEDLLRPVRVKAAVA
ncbi:hypothetical protein V9L00_18190 [Pseudoxanthomonas sp. CCNWLW206]|uniref:hypothetical protein n=1 Tax=Pseudoxanthomonas sp. CCNWLY206 TaxID=3128890 RepID=UPI0030B0F012